MVARRGKPEVMTSDNGTNFTSAERKLHDLVSTLDQTRIKEQVAHDRIQWRFNRPGGSHHGGIFEALIKSAKKARTTSFTAKWVDNLHPGSLMTLRSTPQIDGGLHKISYQSVGRD